MKDIMSKKTVEKIAEVIKPEDEQFIACKQSIKSDEQQDDSILDPKELDIINSFFEDL